MGLGGLAMISFWLPLPYVERYPYPSAFISRFLITYAIVSIITYWFEYFRDRYRQRMEAEKRQLNREKTRLKKVDQALRVNQQRFQEILKHSRDILYRRDLKTGRYDYVSRAFGALLNFTEEEIDDMAYYGVENMIHADDRDRHRLFIEQLLTHKPGTAVEDTIEYRMIDKNGASHWFSDRLAVVADTHGKAAFILGNNREITAQRKAEQAVRHAHSRIFTILDSIDAHVYVADLERYDILFMNRKMKKAFGDNTQQKKMLGSFQRRRRAPARIAAMPLYWMKTASRPAFSNGKDKTRLPCDGTSTMIAPSSGSMTAGFACRLPWISHASRRSNMNGRRIRRYRAACAEIGGHWNIWRGVLPMILITFCPLSWAAFR